VRRLYVAEHAILGGHLNSSFDSGSREILELPGWTLCVSLVPSRVQVPALS
jgi:hypothetical protein